LRWLVQVHEQVVTSAAAASAGWWLWLATSQVYRKLHIHPVLTASLGALEATQPHRQRSHLDHECPRIKPTAARTSSLKFFNQLHDFFVGID